jgi:hypothetical protein
MFMAWWDHPAFNRALVVLRGVDRRVDLGDDGSPGWRLRRWTGGTRIVADADVAGVTAPLGTGASTFVGAESVGGPAGSVAIGHLPCRDNGSASLGTGTVTLVGGTKEVDGTCPTDVYPPAAAAPGSTEWTLTGAAAGVSDVPARLVVFDMPSRRH